MADRTAESGAERRSHVTQTIPAIERRNCTSCLSPLLPTDSFCAICGARQDIAEAPTVARPADDVPSRLIAATQGKYEFIKELGHGGMGNVYLARDLTLERLDAIKVLRPSMLAEEGMVERFRREARTIANLRHESIVTVYGVGHADGLHYFIMDYIDGTSLSRVLKHVGRLSIQAVEAILYQVGSALSYAHQAQSVVHRDVKPSNIMLTREGRAIVTDFGIAKVSEGQAGLTRTGVLMGTPEYMSPEQCRESTVTHHTDQYALGAVAFAMLTGSPPFTGQWLQVAAAHQTKETPKVQNGRPDCPDPLAQTVERMLAKVPTDRWPDIKDALRHLELRPLAGDDPAIREIAGLVSETMDIDAKVAVTPLVSSRTPTNLRITSPTDEVETGDVLQLHASMVFADGAEQDGSDVTWESTDPRIASVDPVSGRLVAHSAGSVQISAQRGELSGSLPIGIVPPRVVEIAIEPQGVALEVGQSFQLRAEPKSKRGEPLERPVTWSSSNPRAVRVSEDGIVRALLPGQGSILAHCDGAGASTTITVIPGASSATTPAHTPSTGQRSGGHPSTVARISISRPPHAIRVSDVFTLTATPMTSDGQTLDREVTWRVDDASVVEQLSNGRFLAVGLGDCRVTAEVDGFNQTVSLRVGTGTGAGEKEGRPLWRRSTVVASLIGIVVVGGILRAVWPGGGGTEGDGGGPSPAQPTVATVALIDAATGASVDVVGLSVGESRTLTADLTAGDGTVLDRPVSWTSSDPTIASIDGGGVVRALAGGSARITASVDGVTSSVPVQVESLPARSMALVTPDGLPAGDNMQIFVGETRTLTARIEGGTDGDSGPFSWRSRNPGVAGIESQGGSATLTGLSVGSTLVAVTAGDQSASALVTVLSPPPVEVQVSIGPVWANLYVDGTPRGQGLRLYELSLEPGNYQIRAENPRFPAYVGSVTVPIRSSAPIRVNIDLSNN